MARLSFLTLLSPKHLFRFTIAPKHRSFATSTSSEARLFLAGASVNYHFTRVCNYECHFCFHTEKSRKLAPVEELKRVVTLLADAGVRKINIAGGEPLRFANVVLELLKLAKSRNMYTSIITNGSLLKREWMAAAAPSLDMLGVSFDAASDKINAAQGRWPRGAVPLTEPKTGELSRAVKHLLFAANCAAEFKVPLKVNTVVTRLNAGEDVSPFINKAAPERWKIFQVLPIEGENTGAGAIKDITPLLVSDTAFDEYIKRNAAGLTNPAILKRESNAVMQSSYILLDEKARFLDCSTGGKIPTASILDVGVEAAAAELLASAGGGFDAKAFQARDGDFYLAAPPPAPATEKEVEVKFAPPPTLAADLAALGAGAPATKTFTDVYFDAPDFRLVSADHWLRARDGALELKSPAQSSARGAGELRVDFYTENRVWADIAAALRARSVSLPRDGAPAAGADAVAATAAALARGGLAPFATLTTRRARHALRVAGHAVHVDIDAVSFGATARSEPDYVIGEVELVAPAPGVSPRAALRAVLAALRVPETPVAVRGKVLEFIHRFDAPRWEALRTSGVLNDKLGASA